MSGVAAARQSAANLPPRTGGGLPTRRYGEEFAANHVASPRRKLEPAADNPRWLKTVHGVGYKLEGLEDEGRMKNGWSEPEANFTEPRHVGGAVEYFV